VTVVGTRNFAPRSLTSLRMHGIVDDRRLVMIWPPLRTDLRRCILRSWFLGIEGKVRLMFWFIIV
jgi:hypothetical protein